MMYPRTRKTALAGDSPRGRTMPAKAAGDAGHNINDAVGVKQPKRPCKNKIPKNVRYDLENALVGLCDVWFENIKPHLLRNNIKVHVHNGLAVASGDYERLPAGARGGCSHHDPGAALDHRRQKTASCADSCLTQHPTSRVPSRKPPASPPHLLQTRSPLSPVTQVHIKNPDNSNKKKSRPRKKRKAANYEEKLSPPQPNWRVPRLCRTYSLLTPVATPRSRRRSRTASRNNIRSSKPCSYTSYQYAQKRKKKLKENSTQTEWPANNKEKPSMSSKSITTTPFTQLSYDPCPATTSTCKSTTQKKAERKKRRHFHIVENQCLFKNDLIDIISEKNDKRLMLLYKRTPNDDVSSVINLVKSPCDRKTNICTGKNKPWR